jgi:Domain of unknown function (DUF4350)
MPVNLDRTDRALLTGSAIVLVILAVASAILAPTRQSGTSLFPSTYSASWDDAKAAYLLLDELGYPVERWNQSPTELDGDASAQVLILANPIESPTPEEVAALRRFLEQGGRIVATGGSAAMFLPSVQPFFEFPDIEKGFKFPALLPSPITLGAPEIVMGKPENWQPTHSDQLVVYGDTSTAAVMTFSVGKGTVVWWGSPAPLTNRGIKESGSLALLLNSVSISSDGKPARKILWDEYFHGARSSLWSYVSRTPLPWVLAQMAVVFAFVLFSFSRRYGAIRMPGKNSRLSPLEFVDTLGDLYTTAHAGSAAVRAAYQRFRFQLGRQIGLPSNAPYTELAHTAARTLGWEAQPLLGSLARAERATRSLDLSDDEALEIVQDLHRYASLLEIRNKPALDALDETRRSSQQEMRPHA